MEHHLPPKTSQRMHTSTLTIKVTRNAFPPVFKQKEQNVKINDRTVVGSQVAKVEATDKDKDVGVVFDCQSKRTNHCIPFYVLLSAFEHVHNLLSQIIFTINHTYFSYTLCILLSAATF